MEIPTPPLPEIESAYGWLIGAGGVFVGAVLLLWGGKLSRLLTAIIGAGLGLVLAQEIIIRSDMDPLTVRIGVSCGCAIFGFLLARLIWAGVLASLASTTASLIALWQYLPEIEKKAQPAYDPAAAQNAQKWAEESARYSQTSGEAMWDSNYTIVLLAILGSFIVPMILFLLLPRFGKILATSIAGAMTLMAGLVLVGVTARGESLWPADWRTWGTIGAATGGVVLLGIILQYIFSRRKSEEQEEQKSGQPVPAPQKGGE